MTLELHSLLSINYSKTALIKAYQWIYEHPTNVKIIKLAYALLSIMMVATPFILPFKGRFPNGLSIAFGLLNGLIVCVTHIFLDCIFPHHHDMKNHVYIPKNCNGGKLYYDGDVPILSLDSDDPFVAGKAHGYLCGAAISSLSNKFLFFIKNFENKPQPKQIPHTLSEIRKTLHPEHLKEMEGIIEGYNEWKKEQLWWNFPTELSVNDILFLFHLLPDFENFKTEEFEYKKNLPSFKGQSVACTAIVVDDSMNPPFLIRNMDWSSLGVTGTYSLIIHRKHKNRLNSSVEVGLPGFVGTLTGINDKGLAIAMNVRSGETNKIKGMPATLYNRFCLEKCSTVQEVETFIGNLAPFGPYHLTVLDKSRAESIHFYQLHEYTHIIRRLEKGKFLTTLNCSYTPHPQLTDAFDRTRASVIDKFFKDKPLSYEDVQSEQYVNNGSTIHRIVISPKNEVLQVAFDNAYAGSVPLHNVPLKKLFG